MKFIKLLLALIISMASCGHKGGVLLEPVSAREWKVFGPVCTGGVMTIDPEYQDQVIVTMYCGDLKAGDELKFLTRDIPFESYQYRDGEQVIVMPRVVFNEIMREYKIRIVDEDGYFQLRENWHAKIPLM